MFIASQFLDQLLNHVLTKSGSDIHIEPDEKNYRIRIRYDGLLQHYTDLTLEQGQAIVSRLKILSHLDIAEKRLPQDGRLSHDSFPEADFRLSTCPTVFGEKIVIRNLNSSNTILSLAHLGMNPHQFNTCHSMLSQPQGLILVTGPTGSGKTSTLYSALQFIHQDTINIVTIEDPVEIYLKGINQTNVNPKAGLGFSSILKSILRQDPDVIMIGEIRDHETAELALAAAQTGHLVLSTLHTNTTIDSIIRLLQMGFESYHIQSALLMVIAQRLVRRLCPHCKQPAPEPHFYYNQWLTHFIAQSCDFCHGGYHGRTAIYEILVCDDDIKKVMQQQSHAITLKPYHEKIFTIQQHAIEKINAGETSVTEVVRILGEHR